MKFVFFEYNFFLNSMLFTECITNVIKKMFVYKCLTQNTYPIKNLMKFQKQKEKKNNIFMINEFVVRPRKV